MLSILLMVAAVAWLGSTIAGLRKAMRRIDAASAYLKALGDNTYAWAQQQIVEGNFDLNPVLRSATAVRIHDMMKEPWQPFPDYFAGTLVEAEGLLPHDR